MLKTVLERILCSPDVNTDSASSNESDVNQQDSSTAQQDVNNTDEGQQQTDKTSTDNGDNSSEDATGDEQTGDQQEAQSQQQTEQHVPYDRFKEVNDQLAQLKTEAETNKAYLERVRATDSFLQQYGITPQQYQDALQYLAALRTDPARAYQIIKPTYDQLAMFSGERLPEDLQAQVAAGTLDQNLAKEIAQGRARNQYSQVQQQWGQQNQASQLQQVVNDTTHMWETLKAQIDPDFKAKSGNQSDGIYELTAQFLSTMRANSAQEAQQNCEKAYNQAKSILSRIPRAPIKGTKPGLQSQQRNTTNGNIIDTSKGVDSASEQVARAISRGVKPADLQYR